MDLTELLVAATVAALAAGTLGGIISSYFAVGYFHRHTTKRLTNWEERLMDREERVEGREWVMDEREAEWAKRAADAARTFRQQTDAINDDTVISELDWDQLGRTLET